ncbi:hypothetical protein HK105_208506 [Polyrhizophydium stewartii]|uniref:Uncharacterized protein n=1 Tax=Polyrhizophydium stewartii TaxID=2732419 RepID=A0ABR4MXJ4_9FUNG
MVAIAHRAHRLQAAIQYPIIYHGSKQHASPGTFSKTPAPDAAISRPKTSLPPIAQGDMTTPAAFAEALAAAGGIPVLTRPPTGPNRTEHAMRASTRPATTIAPQSARVGALSPARPQTHAVRLVAKSTALGSSGSLASILPVGASSRLVIPPDSLSRPERAVLIIDRIIQCKLDAQLGRKPRSSTQSLSSLVAQAATQHHQPAAGSTGVAAPAAVRNAFATAADAIHVTPAPASVGRVIEIVRGRRPPRSPPVDQRGAISIELDHADDQLAHLLRRLHMSVAGANAAIRAVPHHRPDQRPSHDVFGQQRIGGADPGEPVPVVVVTPAGRPISHQWSPAKLPGPRKRLGISRPVSTPGGNTANQVLIPSATILATPDMSSTPFPHPVTPASALQSALDGLHELSHESRQQFHDNQVDACDDQESVAAGPQVAFETATPANIVSLAFMDGGDQAPQEGTDQTATEDSTTGYEQSVSDGPLYMEGFAARRSQLPSAARRPARSTSAPRRTTAPSSAGVPRELVASTGPVDGPSEVAVAEAAKPTSRVRRGPIRIDCHLNPETLKRSIPERKLNLAELRFLQSSLGVGISRLVSRSMHGKIARLREEQYRHNANLVTRTRVDDELSRLVAKQRRAYMHPDFAPIPQPRANNNIYSGFYSGGHDYAAQDSRLLFLDTGYREMLSSQMPSSRDHAARSVRLTRTTERPHTSVRFREPTNDK